MTSVFNFVAFVVEELINRGRQTDLSSSQYGEKQSREPHSGTNERICLVKGKIASVLKVADAILEKIREKVDSNTPADIFDHKGMERKNEVSEIFMYIG